MHIKAFVARQLLHLILLLALALGISPCLPASAQSGVGFGAQTTENHFPNGLQFKIHAQSSSGKIVSARLSYRLGSDPTPVTEALPVEPDYIADLAYELNDLRGEPPGLEVTNFWEVTLEDGSEIKSPEVTTLYDDNNYTWETLENEQIAVRWHDRPQALGQQVFDIARMAVKSQSDLFGASLDYQMHIIIYNNYDEFLAWNRVGIQNIGGQAFPELGITVQVVPDEESQNWWLYEVIPHEISHLYFYQVTRNPDSEPPMWLNEGVAQYNEFVDNGPALSQAEEVIWDGKLVPLESLSASFRLRDEEKLKTAYAESISAVTCLVETYGTEGLSELLADYKSGQDSPKAFSAALGVTPEEFQSGWLAWVGAPPELYPSATHQITPVPTDLPTPIVLAGQATTATLTENLSAPPPGATSTPAGLRQSWRIVPGAYLSLLCGVACLLTVLIALGAVMVLTIGKK